MPRMQRRVWRTKSWDLLPSSNDRNFVSHVEGKVKPLCGKDVAGARGCWRAFTTLYAPLFLGVRYSYRGQRRACRHPHRRDMVVL